MCPSDTGYEGSGQAPSERHFNNGLGVQAAGWQTPVLPSVSNYLAVFGHRSFNRNQMNPTIYEPNTGMFWRNSRVNSASIIDGLSNTAAVGERESRNCRSGSWVGTPNTEGAGVRGAYLVGGGSRPKLNQPDPPIAWNDANNQGCGEGFSSLHPNGAQFVFADGSVHFITDSIDHNWLGNGRNDHEIGDTASVKGNGLYQRLLSRNDELPLIGEY
jgi:prepilin-type processing-associated H-X9-DG protein